MSSKSIFVNNPDQIPTGEHWAIIEGTSVFIPGDERSRTAPGHGYPEHTEHYTTYHAFTDEAEFKTVLERKMLQMDQQGSSRKIRGIHVLGTYVPTLTLTLTEKKNP